MRCRSRQCCNSGSPYCEKIFLREIGAASLEEGKVEIAQQRSWPICFEMDLIENVECFQYFVACFIIDNTMQYEIIYFVQNDIQSETLLLCLFLDSMEFVF